MFPRQVTTFHNDFAVPEEISGNERVWFIHPDGKDSTGKRLYHLRPMEQCRIFRCSCAQMTRGVAEDGSALVTLEIATRNAALENGIWQCGECVPH